MVGQAEFCFSVRESECKTFLPKFRITLKYLPISKRFEHMKFLEDKREAIQKASSVSEIFKLLRKYWNYTDFALLRRLINEFGDNNTKEVMERYISSLETFERRTTIKDYEDATGVRKEVPQGFFEAAFEVHGTKDPSEYTLYEVRLILESLARQSSLEPYDQVTDERTQEIIDQALESGSVQERKVVAVITGLMGSGKTWLLSRLFHQPPPDFYTSTGIAEQSYRGLLHHIGNMSTGAWNFLSHKDIREFLAPVFVAGMTEANVASLAANLIAMDGSDTTSDNPLPLPPSPSMDTTSMTPSQSTLPPTPMLPSLPEVSPTYQAMVRLVKKTSGSTSELLLELVHMIDTGGQPEYMEVMPCLIHNANLALLVLNLMYGLDEHFPINFYVKGVAYKRKLLSQYTGRQIILKLLSTLKCKKSAQKVFHNIMLVVATHRDCVKGDLAALIDALNQELHNLLLPVCKEELILYEAPDKVAFVLNLKNPDGDDDKALDLIRQKVSESNLGGVVKVPGSFLMYEQDLLNFAASINRDILSLDECLQVGDRLKMNGEVVKAALVFFHCHNTFLYFRHVLPNHVFVKPQVALDFVNAIVRFSYRVSAGDIQGFPAKFVSLLQDAIITEEMLSHSELSSCFIPGLYEPEHAIKLFCHTFTIAPLSCDQQQPKASKTKLLQPASGMSSDCSEYLMMCLLPAIPDQEIPQHIPSSSNVVPLVVKFTDDCVPLSCFSSTVSCLLSKFNWSVSRKPDGTPECLAHNIVSLFSPDILADKIVLVESAHSIEVYIEAAEEAHQFLPDICSEVRETVFSAVTKVLDIMRLTEIEISPAIFCPCKKVVETHTATVIPQKTEHFLRCSTTNKLAGKTQDTHLMWLGSNSQPRNQSSQNLSLPTLAKSGVPEQQSTPPQNSEGK